MDAPCSLSAPCNKKIVIRNKPPHPNGLDGLVSGDCICLPSSVFLTFETMLVCLHTSHTDAFHVLVSEIETMAVDSLWAS